MSARCRSCGAAIAWCRMVNSGGDRRMPLDQEPAPVSGNVRLVDGFGSVLSPIEAHAARATGETLYLSHFATCPNAATHRRPR